MNSQNLLNKSAVINYDEKIKYLTKLTSVIAKNGIFEDNGNKIVLYLTNPFSIQLIYNGVRCQNIIESLTLYDGDVSVKASVSTENGNEESECFACELALEELRDLTEAISVLFPNDRNLKELRINPTGQEEVIEVYLDPYKNPIAYQNRVADLMLSGSDFEDAKKLALEPLEMELFFQQGQGMFLVESEAVECTDIYSPYTAERYKSPMEDEDF